MFLKNPRKILGNLFLLLLNFILIGPALLSAILVGFLTKSNSFKKRVLIAGIETSANMLEISRTLSGSSKYQVTVMEFREHPFYGDINCATVKKDNSIKVLRCDSLAIRLKKEILKPFYVFKILISQDIVFFNWIQSFMWLNLDYVVFYLSNKKLIVRHCGDDVRYRPLQHGVHSFYGVYQWQNGQRSFFDMLRKAWRQRIAETFAIVLSTRDHATFQGADLVIRPYVQSPLKRSITGYREKPFIFHAPSDPKIKGTYFVAEALNQLHNEGYIFDYKILTGVRHDEVLKNLVEATIVIDQPGAVPARFAVESMASGCVVIGGNVFEINKLEGCPIIRFKDDVQQLKKDVVRLLNNPMLTKKISEQSFAYWQQACSPESFLIYFEKVLNGTAPTFSKIAGHPFHLLKASVCWYEKLFIKLLYWDTLRQDISPYVDQ